MKKINASELISLGDKRRFYLDRVDALSDKLRHVDPVKLKVYDIKYQEAILGGGELLKSECSLLGTDISKLCYSVISKYKNSIEYNNSIELSRIKAKSDIRLAKGVNEMYEVFLNFKSECNKLIEIKGE